MKPIKMFGLAALAALMAMAFAGASSAMAEKTTLCTGDGSGCGVTHVHETTLSGAKGTLLSSVFDVECDVLFLGDAAEVAEEGAPFILEGKFTYTNCNNECTATEENSPAEIKVLRTGHETASVTGEGLVHLVCGFFINCRYNGTGLEGTGKGPLLSTEKNGEVSLTGQETTRESGFCPEIGELDITTTPLSATYVSSATTHYCVKYEHAGRGFYLTVTNHICGAKDANRLGNYGLVYGPSGLAAGRMVCVRLANQTGLYFNAGNGTQCTSDATGNNGWYELATIE